MLPAPPQHRPQPRGEFGEGERLDQVVVGPTIQPGDPILDVVEGREHQDGPGVPDPAKGRAGVEAVESGQDHVEDDEVIGIGLGPLECVAAIADDIGGMAIAHQDALDRVGDRNLVLDDQDPQVSSSVVLKVQR